MRLGINPLLDANGFILGLIAMRRALTDAADAGYSATSSLLAATDTLVELAPKLQTVMVDMHNQIAPHKPPLPLQAFLRLEPTGTHSVWLHNTQTDEILEAVAHNPADAVLAAKNVRAIDPDSTQRNVIVWFKADPKPGAKWRPADEMRLDQAHDYPPIPGTNVMTPFGTFRVDDQGLPVRIDEDT